MDMESAWTLTREATRLVRQRKHLLYTFGDTRLPYLCVVPAPAGGDGVRIHAGTVSAKRPRIAVPGLDGVHDFEGFLPPEAEWARGGADGAGSGGARGEEDGPAALPVWIARRIAMPSGQYVNERDRTRDEPGPLPEAVERLERRLDDEHDIRTAVLVSDDRVWRLSVLLYIASQVARSAPANILEHFERRHPDRLGD